MRINLDNINSIDDFRNIVREKRGNCTLVLKVTNVCHLNCKYCYHLYENTEDMTKKMDIETFKESILKIGPAFEDLHIHMHGGEPLTLTVEELEERFKFINDYKEAVKDFQTVRPAIQTNLTLLTPEKLELIKKYNISISTSYDGNSSDVTRNLNKDKYMDKLSQVDNCGIINVVTSNNVAEADKHINSLESIKPGILCNPVIPYCCSEELKLSPGEYSDFIIKRFNHQIDNGLKFTWDVTRYILPTLGLSSDCVTSICLNTIITVTPQGRLKGCDVRNEDEWIYGNINDINNFYDIFSLEGYERNEIMYFNMLKRCKGCKYRNLCLGGCLNRTTLIDGELYRDSYCYDTRKLLEYFENYLKDNQDNLPEQIIELINRR